MTILPKGFSGRCKKCNKEEGSIRLWTDGVCEECYLKMYRQREREEESDEKIIGRIKELVDAFVSRSYNDEEFETYEDYEDESKRTYNLLFSFVINTLKNSFFTAFEKGTLQKSVFEEFIKLIEPWIEKIKDWKRFKLEDYSKFKANIEKVNKTKQLKGITKIVKNIENAIDLKELLLKIEGAIKKNRTEFEEEQIKLKVEQMRKLERERYIREEAERRLYGSVKTSRQAFSNTEKEMVLSKFGYKCAICGANEGLHIHHKDQNPKNNQLDNLVVLCGVCHKKIHMKVR